MGPCSYRLRRNSSTEMRATLCSCSWEWKPIIYWEKETVLAQWRSLSTWASLRREAKARVAHLKRAFRIHIFICKCSGALWESDGAFQDKDAAKPTLADTTRSDLATDLSLLYSAYKPLTCVLATLQAQPEQSPLKSLECKEKQTEPSLNYTNPDLGFWNRSQ